MTTTIASEIPLTPIPQKFAIAMGGQTYQMNVVWNQSAQAWVVDLLDSSGNALIGGIPMVCGADLFEQFAYLGIGGQLVAETDSDPNIPPTFEDLGITGHLYFVTKQ